VFYRCAFLGGADTATFCGDKMTLHGVSLSRCMPGAIFFVLSFLVYLMFLALQIQWLLPSNYHTSSLWTDLLLGLGTRFRLHRLHVSSHLWLSFFQGTTVCDTCLMHNCLIFAASGAAALPPRWVFSWDV
jgi:hypothetical protein